MAAPITWQNINGPSLAEASRPLDGAARAFDMGFGALRNVLDQRNQIDSQNWQQGKINNTNTILDQVAGLTTVDAARQAQADNLVGKLKANMGAQVDSGAIRGALEQRVTGLMNQEKQGIEFNRLMADERSMPFMQAFKTASLRGDAVAMKAAEAAYAQAGGRNLSDLVAFNDNRLQQMTERERASDKHRWDGQLTDSRLKSDQVGRTTALGNLKINQANAMAIQQERIENRMTKLREEYAETFGMNASSSKGMATVMKAIEGLDDENDRRQARLAYAEGMKKNPNATTESAIRGVLGMDTSWYTPDALDRGAMIKGMVNVDPRSPEAIAAETRRTAVDARMKGLQAQLASMAGQPGTVGLSTAPAATGTTSLGMPSAPASIPGAVNGALQPDDAEDAYTEASPNPEQMLARKAQAATSSWGSTRRPTTAEPAKGAAPSISRNEQVNREKEQEDLLKMKAKLVEVSTKLSRKTTPELADNPAIKMNRRTIENEARNLEAKIREIEKRQSTYK